MMSPTEIITPVARASSSSVVASSTDDLIDRSQTVTSADFAGMEDDFAEMAREENEMAAAASATILEANELESDDDEPQFTAPRSEAEAAAGTGPVLLPDGRPPADPNEYLQVADKKTGKIFEDNGFALVEDGTVRLRSTRTARDLSAQSVTQAVSGAEVVGEAGVDGNTAA